MIKSKLYGKIGFVAGVILVMFTYWLGGGEFERGEELAFTFVVSVLSGMSFFAFGDAFEQKDKQ